MSSMSSFYESEMQTFRLKMQEIRAQVDSAVQETETNLQQYRSVH
jgi:hypothetical protein